MIENEQHMLTDVQIVFYIMILEKFCTQMYTLLNVKF